MSKEKTSEKKELAKKEEAEPTPPRPRRRPSSMIEPYQPSEMMHNFDRIFDQFRREFESLLWPTDRLAQRMYSLIPRFQEDWPMVDLEDRGNDYCLTVEVPGFKKEDLEIEVEDQAVDVKGQPRRKAAKEPRATCARRGRWSRSIEESSCLKS